MAIQPDVYPGRKTIKNPGQAPGPKTTQDPGHAPGQKAIPGPGPGPGQSLQDPGHLPRLPPPRTATAYMYIIDLKHKTARGGSRKLWWGGMAHTQASKCW